MEKNINSFAENMRKTITALANALSLLESIQNAVSTKDTVVSYDYENLSDGETNTYQIPSYTSVNNRLKALEKNISNITDGKSTVTLNDGSRRKINVLNLPLAPAKISGLENPTTFGIDSNWFFEDLMFPGMVVKIDLTGKIEDSADRVKISRIIVNSQLTAALNLWMNNLVSNDYDYNTFKSLLVYNSIAYSEDIETIYLPLTTNNYVGQFYITEDPIIVNGNTWYKFDTLYYSTIDENGIVQGNNNILSVGDLITYDHAIFSIIEVDLNNNQVRLKILNGSSFPGVYSMFSIYQDPFRKKEISVRFGLHEYNFIYIKGVNEDFNLLSNEWSDPIKFDSDTLLYEDDLNVTMPKFYIDNVVDWGSEWIAQAKERRISAYRGHTPNAPVLNANDLRVVQINTLINAALDTAEIKNTASEIESTKSQIMSLKQTIAALKDELKSITSTVDYNAKQLEISNNTTDLKNLQASYSTLVNTFLTLVAENRAVLEYPKYHIRGFFPIPNYMYRDDEKKYPEEIIGFDIAYRYICEDNTGTLLNTFTYTDNNGNSVVTGTFTDWIVYQSAIKQRVFNKETDLYEWKVENVADGTEININQIDIPISKGEKVEIKVRTISEAGYPDNPLKSDWSSAIIMSFPSNLNTGNAIASLVTEVNDDALNIAITNNMDSAGVTSHLDDTIPNTLSVNGIYFKHLSDNIAYEDMSEDGTLVITISLLSKIEDLEARIKLLEGYINDQAGILTK